MGKAEETAKGYNSVDEGAKVLRALRYLARSMDRAHSVDGEVFSIRLRAPGDDDGEYLLIARRSNNDGAPEVAFQSGIDLIGTLCGFGSRVRNGSVKWHKDKYAD